MHYKQNNKESKSYVQGLRQLGNTLPRGIKGILKKNGFNYSEIISKWNILVGEEISKCSYPKSLKMMKENSSGILIIGVNRGDEITLEYSKRQIINKINSYFGYKLISEIRLQAINFENKELKNKKKQNKFYKNFEKKIDQIKNTNLKNSLAQLLKAIRNE